MRARLLCLCALAACKAPPPAVEAIVNNNRPEHFFDLPFPSNASLSPSGRADLSAYPQASAPLARSVINGWARRVEHDLYGFAQNTPAYFRLRAPIEPPDQTTGTLNDDFLWLDLNTYELLPLELRFIANPHGDPFYGDNTLVMAPQLGSGARPGHTYAAIIQASAGVKAPEGYRLPEEVSVALTNAGVNAPPAVATVFTVLNSTAELRALKDDVQPRLERFQPAHFKRVDQLAYHQGQTPSGRDATLCVVTFEDGLTSTTYLEAETGGAELIIDLTSGPMLVYEGTIQVWNYQGLADRPYMSAGLMHLQDVNNFTGWIKQKDGLILNTPEPEPMRVVLQLPRGADGQAGTARGIVQYDHGTSGHAYNIVQRRSAADRGADLQQAYANAGFAVISRDAPLYGQRYPLIDEGYGGSLGFYNVVNALAFRDNQRQTAVDGYVLRRYIAQQLEADLPAGTINTAHVLRQGHSLGSVTTHLGLAMAPEDYDRAFVSGTGGLFLDYFFYTGLLQDIDPTTLSALFPLFGVDDVPSPVTPTALLGAVLGLNEDAWQHLDRLHPAALLFQWQMDASDPLSVASDEQLPITALIAPGDHQTPDFTGHALVQALPNARAVNCTALSEYDPHYCLWREEEGLQHLRDWLAE